MNTTIRLTDVDGTPCEFNLLRVSMQLLDARIIRIEDVIERKNIHDIALTPAELQTEVDKQKLDFRIEAGDCQAPRSMWAFQSSRRRARGEVPATVKKMASFETPAERDAREAGAAAFDAAHPGERVTYSDSSIPSAELPLPEGDVD